MNKKCIGQYDDGNETKMSQITLTELGYRLTYHPCLLFMFSTRIGKDESMTTCSTVVLA